MPKLIADIEAAATGLTEAFTEGLAEGPTAFLKSTLYHLLRRPVTDAEISASDLGGGLCAADRHVAHTADARPGPGRVDAEAGAGSSQAAAVRAGLVLWVPAGRRLQHDQPARRRVEGGDRSKAIVWSDLQMAFDDQMFQEVLGNKTKTLEQAIQDGALYACNYSALIGDGDLDGKESYLHGKRRYLPSPVALFYWNQRPPQGYPPGYRGDGSKTDGVLQPIAIQLAPAGTRGATVFTPNDCSGANDPEGWKWQIAKFFVNVACAIRREWWPTSAIVTSSSSPSPSRRTASWLSSTRCTSCSRPTYASRSASTAARSADLIVPAAWWRPT